MLSVVKRSLPTALACPPSAGLHQVFLRPGALSKAPHLGHAGGRHSSWGWWHSAHFQSRDGHWTDTVSFPNHPSQAVQAALGQAGPLAAFSGHRELQTRPQMGPSPWRGRWRDFMVVEGGPWRACWALRRPSWTFTASLSLKTESPLPESCSQSRKTGKFQRCGRKMRKWSNPSLKGYVLTGWLRVINLLVHAFMLGLGWVVPGWGRGGWQGRGNFTSSLRRSFSDPTVDWNHSQSF